MEAPRNCAAVSPAGSRIIGTIETIAGTALADVTLTPKGELDVEYSGQTKLDWDSQKTQVSGNERLFVSSDHLVWCESEVRLATLEKRLDRSRSSENEVPKDAEFEAARQACMVKLAGQLQNKLNALHAGEVIGVEPTEGGWIVHVKSRRALREKSWPPMIIASWFPGKRGVLLSYEAARSVLPRLTI